MLGGEPADLFSMKVSVKGYSLEEMMVKVVGRTIITCHHGRNQHEPELLSRTLTLEHEIPDNVLTETIKPIFSRDREELQIQANFKIENNEERVVPIVMCNNM